MASTTSSPASARIAGWNIDAYIPGDRRRALADGIEMPDRVEGAVLFADISGFTPLTEALAREVGPQRGPEELNLVLTAVFDAILSELHRHGGVVIFFSGDAVTCWFDGDGGRLAVSCGLAMQQAMTRVGLITTPGGSTIELGMKVAVAAGACRRFVTGDPDIQLIDALAGSLLDRVADLEHHTERGEVVVGAELLETLSGEIELALIRDSGVGVVVAVSNGGRLPKPPPSPPRLPRSQSRQWVLPPVYERLRTGRGEFLAELRTVIPIFLRFGGFDFDRDDDAPARLDEFVRLVQRIVDSHGGNVLQLTIGDKGAYLFGVFGAPVAHEDDARRACAAALAVLELEGATAATGLQIGLSRGSLFSGTCGHRHRCTFSCMGDATNLAARLMSAAPAGQIYVAADVAAEIAPYFHFEALAPMSVKGKSEPVSAGRLVAARGPVTAAPAAPRRRTRFLGRDEELATLLDLARQARSGRLCVAAVAAEAGLGKSTLVEEAIGRLGREGMAVYAGATASIGSESYLVWRDIWARLLGLTRQGDDVAEAGSALGAADPELVARLPLLASLLGLSIEDNDLTRSFDAKLRKSSLETLLVRYLGIRVADRPTVLWLDDCHWIDSLSADLLESVVRFLPDRPLLVILTYRPGSFTPPKSAHVIELDGLDREACEELLAARLGQLLDSAPSPQLIDRLIERSEGNPFYLEELANYVSTHQSGLTDPNTVELPLSLSNLVLSRVDALSESPRRTLKVASVVGRQFGLGAVVGAYPDLGADRQVTGYLRRLCAEDLVTRESDQDYAFKHAVIREVTYSSLPFGQRSRLHDNMGRWLEHTAPDSLDLLAHHFWHGTDDGKKREYLVRAGEAAQARFANDAAVDYFRRAAPLVDGTDRVGILMKLGEVLGFSGEWAESEAVLGDAMQLADQIGDAVASARARTERADSIRKQSRFDEAAAELERAGAEFEAAGDAAGQGRVLHLRGTIAAQRGERDDARRYYERSLEIRVALGDRQAEGALYNNLAIVAEYEQDYARSRALNEQALDMWTQAAYRWGIGVSRNNLGMVTYLQGDYDQSRIHLEEAIRIETEVGDPWMVAMARHTLGHTARELGDLDAAKRHYGDALRTFAMSGDRWSECPLLEDVALLVTATSREIGLQLIGAAEAVRDEIGAPRPADQMARVEATVEQCRGEGTVDVDAALEYGRQLPVEAAVELARSVCGADIPR